MSTKSFAVATRGWGVYRAAYPASMQQLRDGDDVIVRFRSGGEEQIEFRAFLVDHRGEVHVEHYLYRPDATTDSYPLGEIVGMRRVPPARGPTDVRAPDDPGEQVAQLFFRDREFAQIRPLSGQFVVDLRESSDRSAIPLTSLREALAQGEQALRERGYGDDMEGPATDVKS